MPSYTENPFSLFAEAPAKATSKAMDDMNPETKAYFDAILHVMNGLHGGFDQMAEELRRKEYNKLENRIKRAVGTAWGNLSGFAKATPEAIATAFVTMYTKIGEAASSLKEAIGNNLEALKNNKRIKPVIEAIEKVASAISGFFAEVGRLTSKGLGIAHENISKAAHHAADGAVNTYLGAKHGMGSAIRKAGEALKDAGASMEGRAERSSLKRADKKVAKYVKEERRKDSPDTKPLLPKKTKGKGSGRYGSI